MDICSYWIKLQIRLRYWTSARSCRTWCLVHGSGTQMHHANPSSQCSLRSFEGFEFLSFQPLEKPQLRSLQTSQLVPYGCSCKVFSGGPKFAFWIHMDIMDSLCSKVCSVLGIWRPAWQAKCRFSPCALQVQSCCPTEAWPSITKYAPNCTDTSDVCYWLTPSPCLGGTNWKLQMPCRWD